MTATEQQMGPRSWAEIAKDVAIMLTLSAIIVAGLVILKEYVPMF